MKAPGCKIEGSKVAQVIETFKVDLKCGTLRGGRANLVHSLGCDPGRDVARTTIQSMRLHTIAMQ